MTTSAARVSVIYYSATGNVHGLAHAFTDRQRSPESRPCTHMAEPCLIRQAPRETHNVREGPAIDTIDRVVVSDACERHVD